MAGRRDYIHELPDKLESLVKRTSGRTLTALQRLTGVGRSTLQQCCDSDDPAYSLLGREHQNMLARHFNFDVSWPEWLDPLRVDRGTGRGIDTAEAFIARLLREESAKTVVATADGSAVAPIVTALTLEEWTTASRREPSAPLGTIAQLALDLGQSAGNGGQQVLVEVSCHRGKIAGSNRSFSVRNAVLALNCGNGRGRRTAIAGVMGLPVVLSNPSGDTHFTWSGTRQLLRWDVSAKGSVIGYLWFDAGVVEGIGDGDVLRVTLSAWLKHISAEDCSDQTFAVHNAAGDILEVHEQTLTTEQLRIIEHISKLILPTDGNGYAEIASHELEMVRKS